MVIVGGIKIIQNEKIHAVDQTGIMEVDSDAIYPRIDETFANKQTAYNPLEVPPRTYNLVSPSSSKCRPRESVQSRFLTLAFPKSARLPGLLPR